MQEIFVTIERVGLILLPLVIVWQVLRKFRSSSPKDETPTMGDEGVAVAEAALRRAEMEEGTASANVTAYSAAVQHREEVVKCLAQRVQSATQRSRDKLLRAQAPDLPPADSERLETAALHEASRLVDLERDLESANETLGATRRQLALARQDVEERCRVTRQCREELRILLLRHKAVELEQSALREKGSSILGATAPSDLQIEAARTAANVEDLRLEILRQTDADSSSARREPLSAAQEAAARKRLKTLSGL